MLPFGFLFYSRSYFECLMKTFIFFFQVFLFLGFLSVCVCVTQNLIFILKIFLNAWFKNVSSNGAVSLYF